jgi:alkaline phosphatase D
VVQLHPCAWPSAAAAGYADADTGLRPEWLPLFDRYEVDLVLSGHSRGYERSFPVRGADCADARRPHPVTTVDSGVFDTSQGTVHLALGGGGAGDDEGNGDGTGRGDGDAGVGPGDGDTAAAAGAAWSARRITAPGYGVAVFDVNPGSEAGGQTSITVRYYHAVEAGPGTGPEGAGRADDYALFDTFTLVRPRSDGRRWHPKEPAASNLA